MKQNSIPIIDKSNQCRDFGSLKLVYDFLISNNILKKINRLIILNTSMVSLNKVSVEDEWFKFLVNQEEDFLGITDSIAINYHIQTYHYSLSNRFLNSKVFSDFLNNLNLNTKSRKEIIKKGEIELTKVVQKNNYTFKCFIPLLRINNNNYLKKFKAFIDELEKSFPITNTLKLEKEILVRNSLFIKEYAHNPSHYRWAQFLIEGYPFVKRELLEINPIGLNFVPFLLPFCEYLEFNYIESDLMRIAPDLKYLGGIQRKIYKINRLLKYFIKFEIFKKTF